MAYRVGNSAAAAGFGAPWPQRPAMVASNWRPLERGTLLGFFDLQLPSGLKLRECTFHVKGDSAWIGLPGKPQLDAEGKHWIGPDGKKAYSPVVEIPSRKRRDRFQEQAVAAVRRLLGEDEG
jgi:hypothetical protein